MEPTEPKEPRIMRVRSRYDLSRLVRGDIVIVYGKRMAYHGIDEHYQEPIFVAATNYENRLDVTIPLKPVFRRVLGGIKRARSYDYRVVEQGKPDFDDFLITAQLGRLVKHAS